VERQEIISSGLLELYALGLATSEQSRQVEVWMDQYPEVAAEMNAIEKAMEKYAFLHAVEPSPAVEKSILENINESGIKKDHIPKRLIDNIEGDGHTLPAAKIVRMGAGMKWLAAAAVLLLIGSTIFNVVYYNKYQASETARMETENQMLAQQEENRTMQNDLSVVHSKYSMPVALQGLEAAPEAAAKIFWMKNTGEVYVDPTNLPAAPSGKQYQLWAFVDGKPVDAGMIELDKTLRIQKMKSFGRAEAFAITLEDTGGNPQPKGDIYVMGKI
jgi:anti-sigma-K factor RskA